MSTSCSDTLTSVIHMCQAGKWSSTDTVHLLYNRTSTSTSITCRCYISHGLFVVKLNDVRLTDKTANRCSSASLLVNSQKFSCKENRSEFGSMFNKRINGTQANTFIRVDSSTTVPDMVWLKIKPKDNSTITITCKKPSMSYPLSRVTDTSSTYLSSTYYSTTTSDNLTSAAQEGPSISSLGAIIIVLCLFFISSFVVFLIIGWHLYRNHKRTSQNPDLSRNKSGTESEETPEQFKMRSTGLPNADRERLNDTENQSDDYYSLPNIRETDFRASKLDEVYDTTQVKNTFTRNNVNYDQVSYFKT